MRLGILGGTFDPIHNGHIGIALTAAEMFSLDKVVLVPSASPPHKKEGAAAPAADRLAMARLAAADFPVLSVSDYEVNKGGLSYSVETVGYFITQNPGARIFFIIGDEAFAALGTWREADRLRSLVTFIVFSRSGGLFETDKSNVLFARNAPLDVSSTEIRRKIFEKKDVSPLVNANVLRYINSKGLYQNSDLRELNGSERSH